MALSYLSFPCSWACCMLSQLSHMSEHPEAWSNLYQLPTTARGQYNSQGSLRHKETSATLCWQLGDGLGAAMSALCHQRMPLQWDDPCVAGYTDFRACGEVQSSYSVKENLALRIKLTKCRKQHKVMVEPLSTQAQCAELPTKAIWSINCITLRMSCNLFLGIGYWIKRWILLVTFSYYSTEGFLFTPRDVSGLEHCKG